MTSQLQFLSLLAVHWVGDFVLQTHWQAANKSENNEALLRHVGIYTLLLAIGTPVIFGFRHPAFLALFVILNGVLHFGTDWCTSRINSRLFIRQFELIRGGLFDGRMMMRKNFDPHFFFVWVGLDQLIHQATLAWTMTVLI